MQPPNEALAHPSVQRLARVALALGELRERVVFIGGAVAPLLQTEKVLPGTRVTKDVDAVCLSASYTQYASAQAELRSRGFREDTSSLGHIHRWHSPDGDVLDLVPAGEHLGASGQEWDIAALETSETLQVANGVEIRVVSASVFLALKFAAHYDRGRDDARSSQDLEDIVALLASRPTIVNEVASCPPNVRTFLISNCQGLLNDPYLEDVIAAHLGNAFDPATSARVVRDRISQIAETS